MEGLVSVVQILNFAVLQLERELEKIQRHVHPAWTLLQWSHLSVSVYTRVNNGNQFIFLKAKAKVAEVIQMHRKISESRILTDNLHSKFTDCGKVWFVST